MTTAGTSAAGVGSHTTAPIGRQLAELKGSDTVAGDFFGDSVAISGTTAVVGAVDHANDSGRVYVFTKTAAGWEQVAELEGPHAIAKDNFGWSVAISDGNVVVGAPFRATNAGRAYVFTKTAAGWEQVAALTGSGTVANDEFGASVAISATNAVVGAGGHANGSGLVHVFTDRAGQWKETAVLRGSGVVAGDELGWSVAIWGTSAAAGAEGYANDAGRVYVFTKTRRWRQTAELKGSDTVAGDFFGDSVAVWRTTAVVGAEGCANNAGRVYVFTKTAGHWTQTAELKGSDTVAGDFFGDSVAISGKTAIVGALNHANDAGRVYVFTKTAAGWKQAAEIEGSDTVTGDWLGFSVAVSGKTAIVAAPNHAYSAGRAYVLEVR